MDDDDNDDEDEAAVAVVEPGVRTPFLGGVRTLEGMGERVEAEKALVAALAMLALAIRGAMEDRKRDMILEGEAR